MLPPVPGAPAQRLSPALARHTDVVLFETAEPRDYYHMIEALRDTVLWSVPYSEVVDIIPAIEDGYAEYEADSPSGRGEGSHG